MGGALLMLPTFAMQSGSELPFSFYYLAALVGFSALIVMRKPKTPWDFAEMFAFGMSGLLLLALGMGWVNTYGNAAMKSLVGDSYTRAGLVGLFVAFGGSLWVLIWKLLENTRAELEGMNLFEATSFLLSRGKTRPRRSRVRKTNE